MTTLLLTLLAGAVTSIGLLFSFGWIGAICGSALFLAIMWSHTHSLRTALIRSGLYACMVSAASIVWFWDAYPLSWLHVEKEGTAALLLLITWLAATIAMSAGPALIGVFLWVTRTDTLRILIAGCLFVLIDEARMWGFALLTYAPQTPLGPHFSIGSLGYALSESPFLLQLSSIGGVQALTFFAGIMASSIAVCSLRQRHNLERLIVVASVLSISVLPIIYTVSRTTPPASESLSVVLVTTRNPIGTPPPSETETKDLLTAALEQSPDLIIFPEGYAATRAVEEVRNTRPHNETLVVSTAHTPLTQGGTYTVDVVYDSTTRGRIGSHSKEFLMALGEYAPLIAEPLYRALGSKRIASYLESVSAAQATNASTAVVPFKSHILAGLLCSESISPHLYKRFSAMGANVLINSANPSWFPDSKILYTKSLQIARVQTVSNNAYYFQASNMLPSFALSPRGTLLTASSWGASSLLTVTIH